MPLAGTDEGKIYDMGTVYLDDLVTPEDERDDYTFPFVTGGTGVAQLIKVRHEGKDQVAFVAPDTHASDANGAHTYANIHRPPAVWLSDLTRTGTKRLGHIAVSPPGALSLSVFDAHLQVGTTLYLLGRVEGRAAEHIEGERPDLPLRMFAVDLAAAHIPHTSVPDANATSGAARELSGDSPFLTLFDGHAYYQRDGDLYRTSPLTSDELVFDTESDGALASGSAAPLSFGGRLYFIARIGTTEAGLWSVYSYDGTTLTRVVFLGTGVGVAPQFLGPGAVPETLSFLANGNIYFLDETAPTFSTALSLTTAGETNALFTFAPSERASYSWVVTERAAVPSSSQLRAAFGADNSSPVAHNLLLDQRSLPDATEAFEASGLTPLTDYHLHLVLIDGAGNESEVASVPFTTSGAGGDAVLDRPPTLAAPLAVTRLTQVELDSPKVVLRRHAAVSLTYAPTEPSTAYWVLAPFSEPAPSRTQVVSGVRADGSAANSGTQVASSAAAQTLTLSSDLRSNPPHLLLPSAPGKEVECRVYVVLEDARGHSSPLYTAYFTTQEDNTEDHHLTVSDLSGTERGATTTATFTAHGSDFEDFWWLALPSEHPPVTRRFIRAGTTFDGLSVPDGHSGRSLSSIAADEVGTFSVTNLAVGRSYTLYFTARTSAGVLSSDDTVESNDYLPVQSLTFSPGAPFLAISSVVVDDASHSASVSFTTPLSGNYYWLVQGASLPVLSGSQIFSGLNANGIRPPASLLSAAGTATDVANPNAFSIEELPLSGDYCVYVTVRSPEGVLYPPASVPFTHTAAARRAFAPHFALPTDPSVSSVSFDSAVVRFTPTADGAYCWVLQDASLPVPTAAQVVAGKDGTGAQALSFSPAGRSLTGGRGITITLSSLSSGAAYTLYVLLSNAEGTSLRVPIGRSFETPSLELDTPVLLKKNFPTSVAITFQSNHAGAYCWVVLPTAAGVPAAAAVTDASLRSVLQPDASLRGVGDVAAAQSALTFEIVGLLPSTDYSLHMALHSSLFGAGYASFFPSALPFRTDELAIAAARQFVDVSADPIRVTATFQSNLPGAYCWVVVPAGTATPSAQQVMDTSLRVQFQPDASFRGVGTVPEAHEDVVFRIQDLQAETAYELFLALSHRTVSTAPKQFSFQTKSIAVVIDPMPPTLRLGFAEASVRVDVSGALYWLVLPERDTAPTVAQLLDGTVRAQLQPGEGLRGGPLSVVSTLQAPTHHVVLDMMGLAESIAYTLYVAVQADNGSLSGVAVRDFTHITIPELRNFRLLGAATDTAARIGFNSSHSGRYFWVALTQSTVDAYGAPTAAQVRMGQNGTGMPASLKSAAGGVELSVFDDIAFTVRHLTPQTLYRVYVVPRSRAGALGTVQSVAFTTEVPAPPPSFSVPPSVSSLAPASAVVTFTAQRASLYCWVVVPESVVRASGLPTALQVRRGQDGTGTSAPLRSPVGGVGLPGSGAVSFPLSGLSSETAYQLFVVLADASNAAFSDVARASFVTAPPPRKGPSFSVPPSVSSLAPASATVTFTAQRASLYCWVVLLESVVRASGLPTALQVRRGQDGTGASASLRSPVGGVGLPGSGTVSFPLLGLSSETAYQLFVVLADASNAAFSDVASASFTTPPPPPPAPSFVAAPSVSSLTPASATVTFTAQRASLYCWVVVPESVVRASGAPNSFQVRHGQDSSGASAALRSPARGVPIYDAGGAVSFSLSRLSSGTSYRLFVVLANASNAAFSPVADVSFATAPAPPPPPSFTLAVTQHDTVRTTATVHFASGAPGRYYWVVQPDETAIPPGIPHLRRGQDGRGLPVPSLFTNAPSGTELPAATTAFEISSLAPDTPYTLYLLLVQADGTEGPVLSASFTLAGIPFGARPAVASFSPNPISDFLRIILPEPNSFVEIYSLSGDLVFHGTFDSGVHTLPFSYPAGAYVFRVSSAASASAHRLVKR